MCVWTGAKIKLAVIKKHVQNNCCAININTNHQSWDDGMLGRLYQEEISLHVKWEYVRGIWNAVYMDMTMSAR